MSSSDTVRVLHVDDEPAFTDLTKRRLEDADDRLTVETARSASDGLDRLPETDYDCIVSDYDMSGMDGIDFLEAVRTDFPDLPFILLTGKGNETVASDAMSAGVTDYFQKDPGSGQYALLANRILHAVERARAQQARERHLEAIESAQEGISILNDNGEFTYVNDTYADLYGYDPDEMLGKHWELIYPDEEVTFAHEQILPTVAQDGSWYGETMGLRADGTTFPEDHVVSQTDHGGLVCTVRDLSDQRNREAELRLKTRAMDEAPVGITISDPSQDDNPLIYANSQFEDLTGYDREAIKGRNCRVLQGERTDSEAVTAMREAIDAQEPVSVELRNYRKDGTEFWNRVRIAPITTADGSVTNFVGFQEDVTERKEREQELQQYERMVNSIQAAACIYDTEGRFEIVNEYLANFHNTTREALEGTKSKLITRIRENSDGDPYQELLDGQREEIHGEIEDEFPGQGHEVLAYRLTPLVINGSIEGVVGVSREVTEQKERQRDLEAKNRRLDEFTSLVSHDLRNPLQVAEARVELAQDSCESEHLDDAMAAIKRSEQLIDDLLTLAREGNEVDDLSPVALDSLVEECWQTVDTAAASLCIETDIIIRADKSRLRQLLENLIRNAVEHGGESVTVTVGDLDDGFYVADDGPGIPDDEHQDVFTPGYSTAENGTGFGLAIVEDIVVAHGWEISLAGNEDGTRFDITGVEMCESESVP